MILGAGDVVAFTASVRLHLKSDLNIGYFVTKIVIGS
jgi:hypothetical protein